MLIELRRQRHWSNQELIACLGLSAPQISRLLHGYQLPSLKYALWMADTLQADQLQFVQAALQDAVWAHQLDRDYIVTVSLAHEASSDSGQVVVQAPVEAKPVPPTPQVLSAAES